MKDNTRKRAIEESFPIVDINRLAVPERNAFKPIYQMHKWFARRASCVFRAILLSAMKPAGSDIMKEFYKNHSDDPDTNGKIILDPFMGGGTTVVEALRLGCSVIGIDLNPVAWFIVKTEVEPVDIEELKKAFVNLEKRKTSSGKSVKNELLSHYKTECPCCANIDADIIYTFWVKSAICTNPLCKKEVPLFGNYIVAQKTPSIRYHRDTECAICGKTFDWEIEPASLIAEQSLTVNNQADSCGLGRGNKRWIFHPSEEYSSVKCPWCNQNATPKLKSDKKERKKVSLTVLYCPHCATVFQYRGSLPENMQCPGCKKSFNPSSGNVPGSGKFLCSYCGNKDKIINSIRALPKTELLPTHPYAIEGYCAYCAGEGQEEVEEERLLGGNVKNTKKTVSADHKCLLSKNNGKFFKRVSPDDISRYQKAVSRWEKEKKQLPYPKQEIPRGEKTKSGLIAHHYTYWHQMFNPRQLLCLSTLIKAIDEEKDEVLQDMLLSAFLYGIESYNEFTRFNIGGEKSEGVFARHDFQPKITFIEGNLWGSAYGKNSFSNSSEKIITGKNFCVHPFDRKIEGSSIKKILSNEKIFGKTTLHSMSSVYMPFVKEKSIDLVITDPPYAGNVNYSELADFFYVWLRLILAKKFPVFSPDATPKTEEIIENPTRKKTTKDFEEGLTQVFSESSRVISDNGLLVFTFHHAEGRTWESLLQSICNAGFELLAVYPIHGEAENSLHLMDKQAISYDLIHVCKKRDTAHTEKRAWAGIRQEVRKKAREEIRLIESGRYGNEPLAPGDIQMILTGKCLELYSRHYGNIVDHEDRPVPLKQALEDIRMMIDQLITPEEKIPTELQDIEPESYVWLTSLCSNKEINSDDVHKSTRGILEISDLLNSGLLVKGRAKRGRTYEVKQPLERMHEIIEKFHGVPMPEKNIFGVTDDPKTKKPLYFADKVQLLLALVMSKENVFPWLERFRGETPQIRTALEFVSRRSKEFAPFSRKIIEIMDTRTII